MITWNSQSSSIVTWSSQSSCRLWLHGTIKAAVYIVEETLAKLIHFLNNRNRHVEQIGLSNKYLTHKKKVKPCRNKNFIEKSIFLLIWRTRLQQS